MFFTGYTSFLHQLQLAIHYLFQNSDPFEKCNELFDFYYRKGSTASSVASEGRKERDRQKRIKDFTENRAARKIQSGWKSHRQHADEEREEEVRFGFDDTQIVFLAPLSECVLWPLIHLCLEISLKMTTYINFGNSLRIEHKT